jgi:hypothetical protein
MSVSVSAQLQLQEVEACVQQLRECFRVLFPGIRRSSGGMAGGGGGTGMEQHYHELHHDNEHAQEEEEQEEEDDDDDSLSDEILVPHEGETLHVYYDTTYKTTLQNIRLVGVDLCSVI